MVLENTLQMGQVRMTEHYKRSHIDKPLKLHGLPTYLLLSYPLLTRILVKSGSHAGNLLILSKCNVFSVPESTKLHVHKDGGSNCYSGGIDVCILA